MATNTITSANAVVMLSISSLYAVPQQIRQFSADDIFSAEPLESAEVLMGVDGFLSAGFVYVPIRWSITLQADSLSNPIFDNWYASQQTAKDIYYASGSVTLPSLGTRWSLTKGALTSFQPMADAGKTLKPRRHTITWQGMARSPYTGG